MIEAFEDNTTFLVLAGGEGQRMGGQDKPLMRWRGKPMVEHVLASAPGLPVLISANRNLERYRAYGAVTTDLEVRERVMQQQKGSEPNIQGPLVGVLGGLLAAQTPWILLAAGDAPNLPKHWGAQLWSFMSSSQHPNAHAVVVHDGERQQHLHALMHTSLASQLQAFLLAGRHEVYKFWEACEAHQCTIGSDHGDFRNLNSPGDLEE